MPDFQIFTEAEIESLRRGGKILRDCLTCVAAIVVPGITTKELDDVAEDFIRSAGAEPGFLGYQGYPATLCTSVNEQCVHGLPSDRKLQDGDTVALDCGVLLDGLYTDACITVAVGGIDMEAKRLLHVTKKTLDDALAIVQKGTHIGDISALIQTSLEKEGFHPVRQLTGHGIGRTLHQFPDIPNFGTAGTGPILPARTLIAIEPIVSAGSERIVESPDGWTLRIEDGALSAHFEHTVLVTESGCDIIA